MTITKWSAVTILIHLTFLITNPDTEVLNIHNLKYTVHIIIKTEDHVHPQGWSILTEETLFMKCHLKWGERKRRLLERAAMKELKRGKGNILGVIREIGN